jgi:hypothetical protein
VKRTPLRRISAKRRRELAEYAKNRDARRVFANGQCEAWLAGCTYRGTQTHHVLPRGRGGDDSFDNLRWVDAQCHAWIHDHPAEAAKLELLRSRVAS